MSDDKKTGDLVPVVAESIDTRRRRLTVAAGVAAAGTLASPWVHAQQKTIRFLNCEPSRDSVRAMKVAAAEYERVSGVRVVVDTVPPDQVYDKLQASISAGTPYDISGLIFVAHVVLLAEAGKLVPLTKMVNKHKWGPRILFPVKGEQYWYPYDYNFAWMYYRKDLYAAKGLKVPTTWDQFADNAKALTAGNNFGVTIPIGSNGAGQWLAPGFMWADGVKLLDDKWGLSLDTPPMKKTFSGYLDFMKKLSPSMPPGMSQALFATVIGQYSGGQTAMAPYAGRLMEVLEDRAPELAGKTGFFMYPDSVGKNVAVNHGYDGWVVVKTPMQEEAMKFMDWFTENQYINFLHTAPLHFQPPRMDVYDDRRWRAHPLIEKHGELVDFMRSILTRNDVIIRSVDTEGPAPDVRPGKMFESYGVMEAIQSRLIKDMPADEATELCIRKLKASIV
ncbi:ABC transporter substrate-binding protein [Roseateles toxinivorans]|uniref:Carbohydrate ABC transporter substrate-binding protein (CUT1 family) n=1 Tax=Roseateles toxinivorans TaxID=270368 RepID=A0A4R6QUG1_9BURK|nr:extracellular solute-binding protein [Roseateles toxinivorans]TDP74502.1 carbohydrate ABC transporter substrate-binding protein (CUT1 family) [Roseateles toxinivorans]